MECYIFGVVFFSWFGSLRSLPSHIEAIFSDLLEKGL